MGWARDGETASAPTFQEHVEILPWLEAQSLDRRQSQPHLHDIGRQWCHTRDSAGQRFDFDLAYRGNQSRLDYEVRQGSRLAQQDVSGGFLLGRDPGWSYSRVTNRTGSQAGTARAAVTRFAAVREVQPGGERCLQHWLVGTHAKGTTVRVYTDAVVIGCQGIGTWGRVMMGATEDHAKDRPCLPTPPVSRLRSSCARPTS
jgi:hypothetical protein